jgi:hypothetical protein
MLWQSVKHYSKHTGHLCSYVCEWHNRLSYNDDICDEESMRRKEVKESEVRRRMRRRMEDE